MTPTSSQIRLAKILTNRVNAEIADGTIVADKENLIETLDVFLAGNKITMDQYDELTALIDSATTTAS